MSAPPLLRAVAEALAAELALALDRRAGLVRRLELAQPLVARLGVGDLGLGGDARDLVVRRAGQRRVEHAGLRRSRFVLAAMLLDFVGRREQQAFELGLVGL